MIGGASPAGPGIRCLDVGAGAGGVAAWLSAQVGDSGHVVALDLDTRFLPSSPPANRGKLIGALKPGGRIVLSDVGFAAVPAVSPYFLPAGAQALYERGNVAVGQVFRSVGADTAYGRKLMPALFDHGLVGVGSSTNAPFVAGGGEYDWIRLTMEAIRGR